MSDYFTPSDDDFEDLVQVLEVPKSINYFEEVVPRLNDAQFMDHFRVHIRIILQLAEQFEASEYYHRQEGNSAKISPFKFITVFLWFAANEASSYRVVADRFNITKSSLHKVIKRVTHFISNFSVQCIKWPDNAEKPEIEEAFRRNGFPGAIGAIDGTQIRIDRPTEDSDSYLNREHFFSIQAQVVCDHNRKIRDIFVGYPGSVHDSIERVFRSSPLCADLAQICENFYILGDSDYPCLPHLLTPFRDRGQLTRRQRNYNYLLSKNRYVVEHCFGVMKPKFRQLYHLKLRNVNDIVHFIRACAVLHNLAIEDDFTIEEGVEIPPHFHGEPDLQEEDEDDVDGVRRRNEIMHLLEII